MNKFAALMEYIRDNMGETELGLNSMLAYIHQETASGSTVNATKLIRKLCFGTGPTATKKPIIQVQPSGYLVALAAVGYAPEIKQ